MESAGDPGRIAALPDELFALLLGVKLARSAGRGHRLPGPGGLARVGAAAGGGGAGLAAWRSLPGATERRGELLIFPAYLVLVGVQSALVYAATRDPSVHLLRYALLAFFDSGWASRRLLLQPWRAWGVQLATTVVLALLAGTAAIDHLRVLQQAYRGATPLRFADAAARLWSGACQIGRAGYWRSYAITFLTRERVKLTSTEVLRIQEYQDLADAAEPVLHRAGAAMLRRRPGRSRRRLVPLCGPRATAPARTCPHLSSYTAVLDLFWRRSLMLRFLLGVRPGPCHGAPHRRAVDGHQRHHRRHGHR